MSVTRPNTPSQEARLRRPSFYTSLTKSSPRDAAIWTRRKSSDWKEKTCAKTASSGNSSSSHWPGKSHECYRTGNAPAPTLRKQRRDKPMASGPALVWRVTRHDRTTTITPGGKSFSMRECRLQHVSGFFFDFGASSLLQYTTSARLQTRNGFSFSSSFSSWLPKYYFFRVSWEVCSFMATSTHGVHGVRRVFAGSTKALGFGFVCFHDLHGIFERPGYRQDMGMSLNGVRVCVTPFRICIATTRKGTRATYVIYKQMTMYIE